ncbi:MAG: ribonuclease R [Alphaproteobacteria bacterium]|nr:ribonuclease R [Alphaproteobacteria bacterium]
MSAMTPADILEYIRAAAEPVSKRDLAGAFRLKDGARIALKKILRQLEEDGQIVKTGGGYTIPEGLPGVTVIEVTEIDIDGDLLARPVEWNAATQGPPPRIEIMPENKGHPSLKPGDRILARLARVEPDLYEARTIKRLDIEEGRVAGLLRIHKNGAVLRPANKKAKLDYDVLPGELNGAKDGDVVVGEIQPARGIKRKSVRILEILGRGDDPRAISLISLSESGLREDFPAAALADAKNLKVPSPEGREDLRGINLITIDGADARDFDDAVFAEKTPEGFHLIVAIADVAHYVRPGSALDAEAQRRGNSTYFPDRVVPMLPEALSNDLCSLRPHEDRASLAVHMWIDGDGVLQRYKFVRALINSKARTTYEQVQHVYDTAPSGGQDLALYKIIAPLYEAFAVLDKARRKRGALELDLPERQVVLDEKGNMTGITQRLRLDSHKLIEEFMILANVAAAQALEARKSPCVYRVHERPSFAKLESAREFIESFGLSLPKGQVVNPAQINQILLQAASLPYSHLISQVILRTQAQARYSPDNQGHFGLALPKYAHFTSPIRRYADLLVHRSLIAACGLGPGGIAPEEIARLSEICDNISATERTSMEAERSAIDRFTAAFLSERIGARFAGRITGVTRFGLFVELAESGADGLVPMRTLPADFYIHDEAAHALIGRRSGRVFRLGASVTVTLMEADGLTGSTLLELFGHENGADIPGMELKPSRRPGGGAPKKGKPGKPRTPVSRHKNKKRGKPKSR